MVGFFVFSAKGFLKENSLIMHENFDMRAEHAKNQRLFFEIRNSAADTEEKAVKPLI
jgi:hypothetical protein